MKTRKPKKTPRHTPASVMTARELRKALAVSKKETRDARATVQALVNRPPANILEEANAAVHGPRQAAYSHPRENFARIARRWTASLHDILIPGECVTEQDVMDLMVQVKLARLEVTPDHKDSLVDIAGYAACGARVVGIDE